MLRMVRSSIGVFGFLFFSMAFCVSTLAQSPPSTKPETQKRKFYEYKGNYREEIETLRKKFKDAFGYELMDASPGWKADEIRTMHRVFERLPDSFYRLPGLTKLIRLSAFPSKHQQGAGGRIPAATFPKFTTVYRQVLKSHMAVFQDDTFRLEFYDSLFSEEEADLENIVHHEMGHAMDISRGMLSFGKDWLEIAGFSILNLPPLDARPDGDYIYTLKNDPEIPNYAPVSGRHLPTYSRENPQEDFANSIAAYIHYPYFKYSHPARYKFLKQTVFDGKDVVMSSPGPSVFKDKVIADAKALVASGQWEQLFKLVTEMGRNTFPEVEKALMSVLYEAADPSRGNEGADWIARSTCYLNDPEALKLRRSLAADRRIKVSEIMKHERCFRMAKKVFEEDQVKWPLLNLYFFLENGRPMVQFLDPIGLNARARGFKTRYLWTLNFPKNTGKVVLNGSEEGPEFVTGAASLDLKKSAFRLFTLPEGAELELQVTAERYNELGQRFVSTPSAIKFVVHPWFPYTPTSEETVKVRYPPSMMQLEKRAGL
ncbi:MAG: hypothetical protein G3M70_13080 [Candidatus Nitronauta litoralis]|uniref:Uncharacterized protein n=1 Tax=Candidatus Nitronauta litoralis TaxID=2705533 RepID=A0A7T0BXP0_9BACT|nr:MAG: hypothetical protein G3M70_13080 [Candidatus Nitronauta litoralis]